MIWILRYNICVLTSQYLIMGRYYDEIFIFGYLSMGWRSKYITDIKLY